MALTQILLYAFIGIIVLLYVRRALSIRGLKHYTVQELSEQLKGPRKPVLLDVRTDGERQQGSIKGSLHIPLHHLRRRLNELEKHKTGEVVCYCASGNRSVTATAILRKQGFHTANLKGGYGEWKLSGLT